MNKPFDEIYTKLDDAQELVKYLKENNVIDSNMTIWLPFNDYQASNISKALAENGYSNQKLTKEDFYNLNESCDIIISNPPFKKKRLFIERALSFNKDFHLLYGCSIFCQSLGNTLNHCKFYFRQKAITFFNGDKTNRFLCCWISRKCVCW